MNQNLQTYQVYIQNLMSRIDQQSQTKRQKL